MPFAFEANTFYRLVDIEVSIRALSSPCLLFNIYEIDAARHRNMNAERESLREREGEMRKKRSKILNWILRLSLRGKLFRRQTNALSLEHTRESVEKFIHCCVLYKCVLLLVLDFFFLFAALFASLPCLFGRREIRDTFVFLWHRSLTFSQMFWDQPQPNNRHKRNNNSNRNKNKRSNRILLNLH